MEGFSTCTCTCTMILLKELLNVMNESYRKNIFRDQVENYEFAIFAKIATFYELHCTHEKRNIHSQTRDRGLSKKMYEFIRLLIIMFAVSEAVCSILPWITVCENFFGGNVTVVTCKMNSDQFCKFIFLLKNWVGTP